MTRRTLLAASGGAALAQPAPIPIIDTHIHLFDISRPQGVPWPAKDNAVLYKTALPDRYRKLAAPHGIVGAIELECSPWFDDNQWVLDVAAKDKIIVGMIGNLEPGSPEFRKHLDRFHKNPLYLGIRYGNIWGRNLGAELGKPEFIAGMKALAQANLTLDTANQTPDLLNAVVRLTDQVPDLRVVIDHLPQLQRPAEGEPRRIYDTAIHELAKRPKIYVKGSAVLRRVDGRVPSEMAFYRPRLDELWETFGEDRMVYGSDWPNSDQWGPYEQVFGIVRDYMAAKSRAAAEKFFWRNSISAYRWVKRSPDQPQSNSRV